MEEKMLRVNLAGYNVDTDVLEKLKKQGWDGKNNVSPETISAAYARISRDPRPVDALRADAREEVDKARKSNEAIVFKMGHHSVAEHAYLNFDILGLSRLAVESLEEARLCAYTEKSQRYITLDGDYVTPEEFGPAEKAIFRDTVAKQVAAYKKLFPVLHEYQKKIHSDMLSTKGGQNTVEGWAKEDARYALAMATECQLGFSSNARNLEHIIRKMKFSPLAEVRELGMEIYERAKDVVPSLIILSDPEAFKRQFGKEVSDGLLKTGREAVLSAKSKVKIQSDSAKLRRTMKSKVKIKSKTITLLDCTKDPDTRIIAALLHTYSGNDYASCLAASKKMKKAGQEKFIKSILKDATEHDAFFREFEAAVFTYEIILSSSAFAQMKRHRMMSLFKQPYDPDLGYTIPPAVKETKQESIFNKVMDESEKAFKKLKKSGPAAEYVLTNAHRRRILINANLREVYHIARLRMDAHAQWDIQNISGDMTAVTKKAAPLTAALICGKDTYAEVKKNFYK
jgi:flavin-dependent thymidylate synthase